MYYVTSVVLGVCLFKNIKTTKSEQIRQTQVIIMPIFACYMQMYFYFWEMHFHSKKIDPRLSENIKIHQQLSN